MPVNFFGFEITSKKERDEREKENLLAFTVPEESEEAIDASPIGGYGTGTFGVGVVAMDGDGAIKDENHLITLYRTMAVYPEVDYAIDDIVNEAIVDADDDFCVKLNTDSSKVSAGLKTKMSEEFEVILNHLEFKLKAYDIFRRWYVDGKVYYHVIIDKTNPKLGIQELRYVDPRKIKKVKQKPKKKLDDVSKEKNPIATPPKEYYIYNPKGLDSKNSNPIPIAKDAISYNPSGLVDASRKRVISNLQKAIRPWNQLKMLEDAVVIYRISRAPERRVFYVDVGNLPKNKAESYLNDLMKRFKNKVTYNAETGSTEDQRYHRTMLEDFWLPRREGGKGTEVSTLSGGQNLGEIEDILYFRRKLYQAMNVPRTRMESDSGFSIGRDTEITRDEVKFGKFVQRLRNRFGLLLLDLLEKQLLLKNIIAAEDWKDIKKDLRFNWQQDTHFMELQQLEMTRGRMEILDVVDSHAGTYVSKEGIQKNVLRQTDEEIKEIAAQIKKEEGAGETVVSPAGMGDEPMGPEPGAEPPPGAPPESPPKKDEPSGQPEQIE